MNRLRISLTIRFRDVFVDSLVSREFEITVGFAREETGSIVQGGPRETKTRKEGRKEEGERLQVEERKKG